MSDTNILNLGVPYWLAKNTTLDPQRIVDLCKQISINVHKYVIVLLRREHDILGIEPVNPIESGLLNEKDLEHEKSYIKVQKEIYKKFKIVEKRFIPTPLRRFIPGSAVWLHANYPALKTLEIARALGKTKKYIDGIVKDQNIEPINPVSVQIMTQACLNDIIEGIK